MWPISPVRTFKAQAETRSKFKRLSPFASEQTREAVSFLLEPFPI
jgi:hypothetical protein